MVLKEEIKLNLVTPIRNCDCIRYEFSLGNVCDDCDNNNHKDCCLCSKEEEA